MAYADQDHLDPLTELPSTFVNQLVDNDKSFHDGTGITGLKNANLSTDAGELGGAWQSWTPTFTNLSGGTLNYAKYIEIGKTVFWRWKYTLSGANVSGHVTFTLPKDLISEWDVKSVIATGVGTATDSGGFQILVGTRVVDTSRGVYVWAQNVAGTYLTVAPISATVPFTWANTGVISMSGYFEAA